MVRQRVFSVLPFRDLISGAPYPHGWDGRGSLYGRVSGLDVIECFYAGSHRYLGRSPWLPVPCSYRSLAGGSSQACVSGGSDELRLLLSPLSWMFFRRQGPIRDHGSIPHQGCPGSTFILSGSEMSTASYHCKMASRASTVPMTRSQGYEGIRNAPFRARAEVVRMKSSQGRQPVMSWSLARSRGWHVVIG
jgi:hypothetical protein